MTTLRFIGCYLNPLITFITAILFVFFKGESNILSIAVAESGSETLVVIYALVSIMFGMLAVWVFTIGALIMLVQFIGGLVRYFTAKENKSIYLHYFYGFAITLVSYAVIFTVNLPES